MNESWSEGCRGRWEYEYAWELQRVFKRRLKNGKHTESTHRKRGEHKDDFNVSRNISMFSISCIRLIVWLLHNSCLFKSHFPQVPYKYKCWLDQNDPIAYVPWQSDSLVTSMIDHTFESGHLVLKTILPLPLYSKLSPLMNQGEAGGLTAIKLWHQQAIFFRRDKQILTHWTNRSGQQAPWSYSHKKLDLPVLLMRDPHCKMVWKHC